MNSRAFIAAFIVVVVGVGAVLWMRNLRQTPKAANVAEEPAGGRTQAQPDSAPALPASITDPLQPGIPETPDIPTTGPHAGLEKMGIRIRKAVLADGTVGDHEAPGIDFTGLTQKQRNWYLSQATGITCTCGCGQDLLECRRDDATCPISPGLSDSLLAEARKR